ncbi:NAD(P)-dependent dehydrogenase, short-chain alcohol dehydrogenase family [Chitinophaga terrae (ex Kim and Jung 2007)]|uniref:NAD(P)-dependent dehydrogenase, short-chain alcohol dehydrogenase family n=1 Tax=Chitinophaga terrae (ex Kim and Jung 2007) TaxID=408074 RepID=A0A1H4EHJ9_9BACT|nr:SDR family NAD(P)-dependent oxidoreductase [Chitinophaga terrae (ex Kim and Jung 2007)]GEP91594.1 short-chain dehydrogenase [Chitinophaga terrae (ex Kim and Jung 2007)]SEA83712.1 NAD(P)-dependent dehydrogenase, short-chain alcohol dehydrogenase family [Chitinophaga terrae (ex Kim and Jung 2007)]
MARIFITGSADGLGLLAAQALIEKGHQVVLHARNEQRKSSVADKVKGAANILAADLSDIEETQKLAEQVNELGQFDAIIHNAGVYNTSAKQLLHVNVLAPYILTSLIRKPRRLIYLSSGMHLQGRLSSAADISRLSYSDSKLYVLMLSMAASRIWTDVYSNSVDPGWVPTKMGGKGAPDDLQEGYETQVWLAGSNDPKALVSGRYFFHQQQRRYNPEADDVAKQEKLLDYCKEITGVLFPR